MTCAVITTFGNQFFDVYAKQMLETFVLNWPKEIPLLVQLDDDKLFETVSKMIRPQDAVAVGREKSHEDFISRNAEKDDQLNYRKQAVRFCHKVYAIRRAYNAVKVAKEQGMPVARYLIWMDADVLTDKPVSMVDIQKCLPKDGSPVSYLGRKDWPHSECGWLVFDLDAGGGEVIEAVVSMYDTDAVFKEAEWHDSYIFDVVRKRKDNWTNLTEDKPGMDIWPLSPMGQWSTHYKGPAAKKKMVDQPAPRLGTNIVVQTKNSIPDDQIKKQIEENQLLIKNWLAPCIETDEEIVMVSAGPQLVPEDVLPHYQAGKKIVAVKHAIDRLEKVGITPWATILLDPRPHVYDFVKNPNPNTIWIVASQVDPQVTMRLLAYGCKVFGYHAPVGAGEGHLTSKQPQAIITGGSATATRGLFVLKTLGFSKIRLFGYDLCFPDKPNIDERDVHGQPKYLEMSISWSNPLSNLKRHFYSEPQLIAQFEEFNEILKQGHFDFIPEGEGMVPFILRQRALGDLRASKIQANIDRKPYEELLCCKKKKNSFLMKLLRKS